MTSSGSQPPTGTTTDHRRTMRLLARLCERALFDDAAVEPSATAGSGAAAWPAVRAAAERHHVTPLLAAGLRETGAGPAPARVEERLAADARQIARNNLLYADALHEVLADLRAAGVPALTYKGPALAAQADGEVTGRSFVDLDLLVPPSAFDDAAGVLKGAGYERVRRLRGLGEADFVNADGVAVDLHRAVIPRYFGVEVGFETLWDRRAEVSVAGRSVPTLSPVDHLIVVCVHGGKHLWHRLCWTCDVAALCQGYDVSHGTLRRRAGTIGCQRFLDVGLAVTERTFETAVTPATARDRPDALGNELVERRRTHVAGGIPLRERLPVHWRLHDRRRDRLRYVTRLLTIPSERDREVVSLPSRLDGLYRVLRPLRLLWRAGRETLQ